MTEEEPPKSPADPRPNDEPYWRENECEDCGGELEYQHVVEPWKYESKAEFFYDEFMCPECKDGVYMDWPEYIEEIEEESEKIDLGEEDTVSAEEMREKFDLEE